MASGKPKKPSIDDLLSEPAPQGPIRRGAGMYLSTAAPAVPTEPKIPAQVQQVVTSAQSHDRTNAIKRVNRGYKLREDLIKSCKQVALNEDRNLYDVMEEALEQYLERKRQQKEVQE